MATVKKNRTTKAFVNRFSELPERGEDIFVKSAALFAKKGFEGTSINEIAAAVGVTKPTLYYYFKDKSEIFAAIVIKTVEENAAYVMEATADVDRADEKLRAFMMAHAEFFNKNRDAFIAAQLGFTQLKLARDRNLLIKIRDRFENHLREIIQLGVEQKYFTEVEAKTLGILVLSSINWMARWHKQGGPKSASAFAEDFYDIMLNGIADR